MCFGIREAGNISTEPGSVPIFSLNLRNQMHAGKKLKINIEIRHTEWLNIMWKGEMEMTRWEQWHKKLKHKSYPANISNGLSRRIHYKVDSLMETYFVQCRVCRYMLG